MRLLLSIFVSIIGISIAAFYQQNTPEFMRPFLQTKALNNIVKNLRQTSTMATQPTFVGLPVIPTSDSSLSAVSPTPRGIRGVIEAREQSEGAGATVRRSIGTPKLKNLSPFLMLDHFNVGVGAGFPRSPSQRTGNDHLLAQWSRRSRGLRWQQGHDLERRPAVHDRRQGHRPRGDATRQRRR